MSIASEITRLQGVKADILTAIGDKGVTVPVGSALADCPDLISQISTGGDAPVVIPTGYTRLQYVEITDSAPYCSIDNGDLQYFGLPTTVTFGDKAEIDILLNADESTEDKSISFICGNANYGTNGISVSQYLNYDGGGYCIVVSFAGLYNYGSYQKRLNLYGNENAKGFYNFKMFYDENLKGACNSHIVQLGTAPKDYNNQISILQCSEWATRAFKGTKIFGLKYSNKFNFVPCKRDSDGMVGFWENVNGVFVFPRNFSTGSLTAGPAY